MSIALITSRKEMCLYLTSRNEDPIWAAKPREGLSLMATECRSIPDTAPLRHPNAKARGSARDKLSRSRLTLGQSRSRYAGSVALTYPFVIGPSYLAGSCARLYRSSSTVHAAAMPEYSTDDRHRRSARGALRFTPAASDALSDKLSALTLPEAPSQEPNSEVPAPGVERELPSLSPRICPASHVTAAEARVTMRL